MSGGEDGAEYLAGTRALSMGRSSMALLKGPKPKYRVNSAVSGLKQPGEEKAHPRAGCWVQAPEDGPGNGARCVPQQPPSQRGPLNPLLHSTLQTPSGLYHSAFSPGGGSHISPVTQLANSEHLLCVGK